MPLRKRELFEVWCNEKDVKAKNLAVFQYVVKKLDGPDENIKKVVKNFTSKVNEKWHNCNRTLKVFIERYHQWLDEEIDALPIQCVVKFVPANSVGRPRKHFSEVGVQSKRQKVSSLLEDYSTEELSFALSTSLRKSGQRDAATIVQSVSDHSLNPTEIKKLVNNSPASPIKYIPEEALALYVDGRYTKNSYILMQSGAKLRNANIYPSYNVLKKAKKDCYPDEQDLTISEIYGEVKIQALVNHTATRLVSVQQEVLEQNLTELQEGVTLIYKWGCDGSAGHSTYKQKFTEENGSSHTDSYLFAVCIVPLQLQTTSNKILWNNPRPSSTRYCRPIKIIYEKETNELSKREIVNIENQIKNIVPSKIMISDREIWIDHSFRLTMIDGKMFGVITQSSNQACGICGATPKNMNNLNDIYKRTLNTEYLKFGVSSLHAWIRCLEALLHISYRIPIQKWQIRDKTEKEIVQKRKEEIRSRLRAEMGLLIDISKPGFGTTNDGNTARRFFLQPSLIATITGLNAELVEHFSVILRTMSSGYAVKVEAFKEYTKKTAEKYVECYSWYYMPSSIHKILIHGADIIKEAILPIGVFSEEALESRNKDFKKYREFNTRKSSRQKTMRDLFNCLLVSSDPLIASLSKSSSFLKNNHNISLDRKVIALLSDPAIPRLLNDSTNINDSFDSEDSDE